MDVHEELLGVVEALNDAGISYAVCGALAVALHGHPRATRDIDILVPAGDVERAIMALEQTGFRFPATPMTFDKGLPAEREIHRVTKVAPEDHLILDLITGSTFDAVLEGRQVLEWRGHMLPVVSREGLRFMKRLAGRLQDLADLEALGMSDE